MVEQNLAVIGLIREWGLWMRRHANGERPGFQRIPPLWLPDRLPTRLFGTSDAHAAARPAYSFMHFVDALERSIKSLSALKRGVNPVHKASIIDSNVSSAIRRVKSVWIPRPK